MIGIGCCILCLGISGCTPQKKATPKETIITVTAKPITSSLFFSSFIEPITTMDVTSPVDGMISHVNFSLGRPVQKGQVLLSLKSSTIATQYQAALRSYLTAKDQYDQDQIKKKGTIDLYQAGIISQSDYLSQMNSFATNALSFGLAKQKLEELLTKTQIPEKDLAQLQNLQISNTEEVEKALARPFTHIQIKAPSSGIALLPVDSENSGKSSHLTVGSTVKEGNTLLTIGDLQGFKLHVKVNEIDLNQIKPGQKITVTGPSFPNIILHGSVASINDEAKDNQGALPTFAVTMVVPHVSPKDLKIIDIGMSAQVQLTISSKPMISVPINAVYFVNGQPTVDVLRNGKKVPVTVNTGKTSLDSVIIPRGLQVGEQIVVPEKPPATTQ